jgi:hypothetical protein
MTWVSTAGVAALVSGIFLVLGTWINGWRQRVFEERLRQLQFEHERQQQYRSDQRQLRDVKAARVRDNLRQLTVTSVRIQTLIEKLYLFMTEDSVGFWDRELRRGSASMAEMAKDVESAMAALLLDVEAVDLAESATRLLSELSKLEIRLIDLDVLDASRAGQRDLHESTQALLDEQGTLSRLAGQVTVAARTLIQRLELPIR